MSQSSRFDPFNTGVLLAIAGLVAGVWPMTVQALGTPVASGPPALILIWMLRNRSEIVDNSPASEDSSGFAELGKKVAEAVLTEAAMRTAIAVFLLSLGICFLFIAGRMRRRTQVYRVTGRGVPPLKHVPGLAVAPDLVQEPTSALPTQDEVPATAPSS